MVRVFDATLKDDSESHNMNHLPQGKISFSLKDFFQSLPAHGTSKKVNAFLGLKSLFLVQKFANFGQQTVCSFPTFILIFRLFVPELGLFS